MLIRTIVALSLVLSLLPATRLSATPVPGAVLWLDASDIDNDGNPLNNPGLNTPIATWVDKAPAQGAQNATQGTGTLQPLYKPNFQNGQAAVEFNGDILVTTPVTMGPFTIFSAFTSGTGTKILYERSPDVNSNPGEYLTTSTSNSLNVRRGTISSGKNISSNWANSAAIITATHTFNGTHASHLAFVNGNAAATTDAGVADPGLAPLTDQVHIGMRGNGPSLPLIGHVAEMIFYDYALNAASRNIVNNYLSAKYASPMAGNDFYAGDAPGTDYDFHVIGIGRESDGVHATSSAVGLTISENVSAPLGTGDYYMAGEKTVFNTLVADDTPAGVATRWQRVWYIDKTDADNSAGATLTFDFSDAGLTALSGAQFNLLYSPTNAFETSESPFSILGVTGSVLGDQVTFNLLAAQLASGYYTLAQTPIIVPEPSTLVLLGVGAAGLAWRVRRRRLENR